MALNGRFWIAFNGEIYNFQALRKELETEGAVFRTRTDTEAILQLYAREKEGCVANLGGMFAFALWDEEEQSLFLARDSFGIKPLYLTDSGAGLLFASETKALTALPAVERKINPVAVRDYLLWGSVPEPLSLFQGMASLPAGHWRKQGSDGSTESQLVPNSALIFPKAIHPPPDPVLATRTALLESMERHLVSDVPVGIFLSGGLDSTVILALVRQVLGPDADIRTFSIGFDDPAYDESSLARRTAEHFGARHTEWRMTPEDGRAEMAPYLAAMDLPTIDGFNTWCVSKLARREGMKVVLSGLGGDELFAGYTSFQRVPQFHCLYRALGPLRPLLAKVLDFTAVGSPWRRLAAFLRGGGSWVEAYHGQRGIFTADEANRLAEALCGETLPRAVDWGDQAGLPEDARDIVSYLELTRYMRNQLLRDSDVFSMAHGLELRVPFVDLRLFESLSAIPAKIRLRLGKTLLLDAVPETPEWVRNQPKRGFVFPFREWVEQVLADRLAEADRLSPVPLTTWYRRWAVVALLHVMRRADGAALSSP